MQYIINKKTQPYIGDFTMKRDSLKRNIFFSLVLLTSAYALSSCEMYAQEQSIDPVFVEDGFDASEKKYIEQVGERIQALGAEASAVIDTFKSTKTVWGISQYIQFFDTKVEEIDNTILTPLRQRVVARQTRSDSKVFKVLQLTDEIATELHALFMQVRQTLTSSQNRAKALVMAKALDELKNKMLTLITSSFEPKLIALHTALKEVSSTQDLQQGMGTILKSLQVAKREMSKPASNAEKIKIVSLVETVLKKG